MAWKPSGQFWVKLTGLKTCIRPKYFIPASLLLKNASKAMSLLSTVIFNRDGKPVILNMMKHIFASGKDVNDRVYITSKEIVEQYLYSRSLIFFQK